MEDDNVNPICNILNVKRSQATGQCLGSCWRHQDVLLEELVPATLTQTSRKTGERHLPAPTSHAKIVNHVLEMPNFLRLGLNIPEA